MNCLSPNIKLHQIVNIGYFLKILQKKNRKIFLKQNKFRINILFHQEDVLILVFSVLKEIIPAD